MKDILLAILGTWLGGLAIPMIKMLLEDLGPFQLIFYSNIGAVAILLVAKHFFSPGFTPFKKEEKKWFVSGLISGPGIAVPLVIVGMVTVSGSVSGLLFNLETFFSFLLAMLVFKEKLSKYAVAAMLFVLVGGITGAFGGPLKGAWTGMLMIVGSCLFFSIESNLFRKLETQDGYALAIYDFVGAGVVAFIVLIIQQTPIPPLKTILYASSVGVLTYAFGNVLYFRSIKRIGVGRTVTIFGAAPLFGAITSFILLKDPLTPLIGLSLVFVAIGIVCLAWEEKSRESDL